MNKIIVMQHLTLQHDSGSASHSNINWFTSAIIRVISFHS